MRTKAILLFALLFAGLLPCLKAQQNDIVSNDIHKGFAVQVTGSISPYFPLSFLFHQQAPNHFSIGGVAGTYLNKYIFVGGGIEFAGSRGLLYGLDGNGPFEREKGVYLYGAPVFFDFKANFIKTRVSPFGEVRLGFNSSLNEVIRTDVTLPESKYEPSNPRNGRYFLLGAYVSLGLGVKVSHSSYSLGVNFNTVHYEEDLYDEYWYASGEEIQSTHQAGSRICPTLFFRYAYTFQK